MLKIEKTRICELRSQILVFSSPPRPKNGAGPGGGAESSDFNTTLTVQSQVVSQCKARDYNRAVRRVLMIFVLPGIDASAQA